MKRDLPAVAVEHCPPPCPRDLVQIEHHLDELTEPLVCWIDYTAEERGSRERGTGLQMEPDYPESAQLVAAYIRDVDVISLLSDRTVALIEQKYLEGRDTDDKEPDFERDEPLDYEVFDPGNNFFSLY